MAKSASRAKTRIAEGSDDPVYATKVRTAEFYFASEMPQMHTLLDRISTSGDLIAEIKVDDFKVA